MYFHSLNGLTDPYLGVFLDRVQQSFPPNEQVAMSSILRQVAAPEPGHFLACVLEAPGGTPLGIAWTEHTPDERYTCLWYIAAVTQGQGAGTRIYQTLRQQARERGDRALLFEVELPEHAAEPERARRRIAWYERQGARLSDLPYSQSVGWCPAIPMALMWDGLDTGLTENEALDLLRSCFDIGDSDAA